jgi:hypothetical protein
MRASSRRRSWTNASSRLLLDGRTELVRNYSSRRPKTEAAKGAVRAFTLYQRSVYNRVKSQQPGLTPYVRAARRPESAPPAAPHIPDCNMAPPSLLRKEIKAKVGQLWRNLSEDAKRPFQAARIA